MPAGAERDRDVHIFHWNSYAVSMCKVTDTTDPSRLPWRREGNREVSRMVPLLRAEGGEESQVSLEATEDCCARQAEAAALPLSPNETLVVDVTRGLDGGDRDRAGEQRPREGGRYKLRKNGVGG